MSAWVLAVDFGTTNTIAAVGDANGVRTLTIDGRPVMPSAVFLNESGWIVGEAAVRFARRRLDRFERCPKRAIPDRVLFLAGHDVPVVDAITAVFRPIVHEAAQQSGGRPPAAFVVTHPATWAGSRVQILQTAAAIAARDLPGWPSPYPLAEPVAAAQRTMDIAVVPPVARLVVLDLGGGTVDVTVVDRNGAYLTVAGRPTGIDSLGGEDFDLRLARWMTAEVGAPALFDRLAMSVNPEERERAVDIRDHARLVKEQLSRQSAVPAQLPKSPPELPDNTPVLVNKLELEKLIRGGDGAEPGLIDAVDLVVKSLSTAPPGPPLAGVFLVGGSSRIPLLGTLVVERIGQVPLKHGDPTTAVADGAARHALAAVTAPAPVHYWAPPPPPPPPPRPQSSGRGGAAAAVVIGLFVILALLAVFAELAAY
ncbi:Hsp70 family protein [Kibdelosporangium aridum]|uniref:Hsp70 family protein n=1 Tax=Kibdelosporangium aridum TaxID=2030 RepID=UPI000A656788|nr:Hsp70 family protein [Kibdelosporangium aridum]